MKLNFIYKSQNIEIEIKAIQGLPELKILGLGSQEAQTLREIIKAAIKTQGFKLKGLRKILHIKSPVPPNQIAFHLTVMLLIELRQLITPTRQIFYCIGSLNLDGTISRSIPQSELNSLLLNNSSTIFIASDEYDLVNQNLYRISNLKQLATLKVAKSSLQINSTPIADVFTIDDLTDFAISKYALILALKMNASLVLIGASGIGKTMLFRTLPSLGVPPSNVHNFDSSLTVNKFKQKISEIEDQTSTQSTHFLILNELSDYSKSFLDYLKIFFDLLDQKSFLNKYQLLMSLNPCLCGNFKSPEKLCTCNPYDINRNQKKVPFPLLDRIDIVLNLNQLQYDEYAFPSLAHSDAEKILSNSIYVDSFNQFAEHLLYTLQNDFAPSLRRLSKIKKLAQAIASVKFHTEVTEEDVLESINFNANILSINAFK